jgi:hypothetical protein
MGPFVIIEQVNVGGTGGVHGAVDKGVRCLVKKCIKGVATHDYKEAGAQYTK